MLEITVSLNKIIVKKIIFHNLFDRSKPLTKVTAILILKQVIKTSTLKPGFETNVRL